MTSREAVATLVAVTPEAKSALGGRDQIHIAAFPFKVGRESRRDPADAAVLELRLGVAPQLNDVYLLEPPWSDIYQISREHFLIDRVGEEFVLVDRDSACGTTVAGKEVGGDRTGGRVELRIGDVIVVGTGSDYAFRFDLAADDIETF